MMEIEEHIPKENWVVGLLFDEGYFFFRILRKQQLTRYMPFWFDDDVAITNGSTSGWESPADANGRNYLMPQEEDTIYQVFTGITPSQCKLYLQYTQRIDRMSLITPRPVPGVIGFWDGYNSPYRDPDPSTELWTVHDVYPYMNIENPPITGESILCGVSFWITPYTYTVLNKDGKNKAQMLQYLRKEKPATIITMGDGDRPIKAPAWMLSKYCDAMVDPKEV